LLLADVATVIRAGGGFGGPFLLVECLLDGAWFSEFGEVV
jgi:hypothetical protein